MKIHGSCAFQMQYILLVDMKEKQETKNKHFSHLSINNANSDGSYSF